MNIDEIIDFEGEHTGLDFKSTQYTKETFFELLKDVIAMANGIRDDTGLIIMGVKKKPDNSFFINPILKEEFLDAAIYQKFISDNIEPDLHIEYVSHLYKEKELVGVLKVINCTDRPYMMKKDYNGSNDKTSRKKGDSFIRKGSFTLPLMRSDIDRIFEQRMQKDAFSHQVIFYFSHTDKQKILELKPSKVEKLTSQRKAERIKAVIEKKEKQEEEWKEQSTKNTLFANFNPHRLNELSSPSYLFPFSGSTPYENRSLEVLRRNLANVKETYREDDLYELFEMSSEKINILILNQGSKYLEDAVIEVKIPDIQGLIIAGKIHNKPNNSSPLDIQFDASNANYPCYTRCNDYYNYTLDIGPLRHLQPKELFNVPLRILVGAQLSGLKIEIGLKLFGKNLISPIEDNLVLKINP